MGKESKIPFATPDQEKFMKKEQAEKLELFRSVFMSKVPKDNREAHEMIKHAWEKMSSQDRMRYFITLSEEVCEMEWDKAVKKQTLQGITENLLVRTFGDHKSPYSFNEKG